MSHTLKNITLVLSMSCIATVLLAACGAPPGSTLDGQRWYVMNNCNECHGNNANNGRAAHIAGLEMGFSTFKGILRNPYSPSMPPFSKEKLSNQDAADIYAWLKSLPK